MPLNDTLFMYVVSAFPGTLKLQVMTAIPIMVQPQTFSFAQNTHMVRIDCSLQTIKIQADNTNRLCVSSLSHETEATCPELLEGQYSYEVEPTSIYTFITMLSTALTEQTLFVSDSAAMLT
jgi:hypothetical protein